MNKDLTLFMKELEADKPRSVLRIKKEVSPEFEIPAILQEVEKRKFNPVLVFEKVRNLKGEISKLPVIINLCGERERLAYAMGVPVDRLPLEYVAREKHVPPVVVGKEQARVKELIQTGGDVDMFELPVITHHEMDLGPYLTAGSAWVKDPETGFVNCAIIRIYVEGPKRLVVNFNAARHTNYVFQKYKSRGIPMPMVIVIGHHPAFYMGAQTKLLTDEPQIIGGIMGEPLEVTPSETWGADFMVPAQAELVIECELSTSEVDIEAPFGEYTGYYGGQRVNPIADVTAITRKKDAYYVDIMPGHADHFLLDAPMIEAYLYSRIKEVVPGTLNVHMPVSGAARLHAYVQMKKSNDGEPKTAIACALSSDYRVKHVVVVDEDVDIYDDQEVLWAIATRSQWSKDLLVIPGIMGTRLDPSGDGIITSKGGIDATKPFGAQSFAARISIPSETTKNLDLKNYLDPKDREFMKL
jgi:2,5-furandicarboxylate decarboxylase 1